VDVFICIDCFEGLNHEQADNHAFVATSKSEVSQRSQAELSTIKSEEPDRQAAAAKLGLQKEEWVNETWELKGEGRGVASCLPTRRCRSPRWPGASKSPS
jgi:hypothetical protein